LTGHLLKDPDTTVNYHSGKLTGSNATLVNQPRKIEANVAAVLAAIS